MTEFELLVALFFGFIIGLLLIIFGELLNINNKIKQLQKMQKFK